MTPTPAPLRLLVETQPDLDALEGRWRALEGRADPSFFCGWEWTGCLLAERFDRPVLVSAARGAEEVALALFNAAPGRAGERLCLGESGDGRDSPFIEHNGVLLDRREGPGTVAAVLEAALRRPGRRWRSLHLGGVGREVLDAAAMVAGTRTRTLALRVAPAVDLDALRREGRPYLAALGAGARARLRRSRREAERAGPLAVRRAADAVEALSFLDGLARLHQATWTARGRPGAFADPWFRRFHAALLPRAAPEGAELLRIDAGSHTVGFLYNLRRAGRVLSYQGGFDYSAPWAAPGPASAAGPGDPPAPPQHRPGLVCHHAAIELHLAGDALCYDFLGGADRYKRSLATSEAPLAWAELHERLGWPAARSAARSAALLAAARLRGRGGRGGA